jgi:hypothetical protein
MSTASRENRRIAGSPPGGCGRFSVAVVVVPLSLEILCNGRGKKKASLEPEEVEKFHWVLRTFSRL